MQSTDHNFSLGDAQSTPEVGSSMFSAPSTLSERELISAAAPLASRSEADFATVSRIIDVGVAVAMLIVLLPIMLLLPICIWISDPGPVFFMQR